MRTLVSECRSQSYAVEPRLHRRYFYIGPLTSYRGEDVNISLGTTIQPPHRLTWDPQKLVAERNLTPAVFLSKIAHARLPVIYSLKWLEKGLACRLLSTEGMSLSFSPKESASPVTLRRAHQPPVRTSA